MRRLSWLGLVLLGGCAVVSSGGGPEPLLDEACTTGTVAVRGLAPGDETVVLAADGGVTRLRGDQARNVRLLTGASVTVCGGDHGVAETLEVSAVDLHEVDGMDAVLGRLVQAGGGWAVVPLYVGDPVTLAGAPSGLTAAVSKVVWVAGEYAGGRFEVRSFGVLEGWR